MADIQIRDVTKVFGRSEAAALALVRQAVDKLDILARTGCSVGLPCAAARIALSRSARRPSLRR